MLTAITNRTVASEGESTAVCSPPAYCENWGRLGVCEDRDTALSVQAGKIPEGNGRCPACSCVSDMRMLLRPFRNLEVGQNAVS